MGLSSRLALRCGVCLCVALLFGSLRAQPGSDSLRLVWENQQLPDTARFQALQAYYLMFSYGSPDTALTVSRLHYRLGQHLDNRREMAKALNERALIFYLLNQPDSSMLSLQEALSIRKDLGDSLDMAGIYANIGNVYRDQVEYQQAVRHYTLSLDIMERTGGKERAKGDVLNNLGLLYQDIGMYDEALKYLNRALETYQAGGIQNQIGNIWVNIGALYSDTKKYGEGLRFMQTALPMLLADSNFWSVAECYYVMAIAYRHLDQPDSALACIEESIRINGKIGYLQQVIRGKIIRASLLLATNPEEAAREGEQLRQMATDGFAHQVNADLYHLLYQIYKQQNRPDDALRMLERHQAYSDSVRQDEDKMLIVREAVSSEYELKLFHSQMDFQQRENQLKIRQLTRIYLLVLLGLLGFFGLLVFMRNRAQAHKKEQARLLAEIEQLKARGRAVVPSGNFSLNKAALEAHIGRHLNETDWKVLNILVDNPVISNKELAAEAFLSVDGIGSSLRRMYELFQIGESRYMKTSLLMEAIKVSNQVE